MISNTTFAAVTLDTQIIKPLELRDPFKRPREIIQYSSEQAGQMLYNNKYSNFPKIEESSLLNIKVMGVLLGQKRSAILKVVDATGKINNNESYIVHEGTIIGNTGAVIKAILPGGVVVVESIKNVYDQEEFIETIIPVF